MHMPERLAGHTPAMSILKTTPFHDVLKPGNTSSLGHM